MNVLSIYPSHKLSSHDSGVAVVMDGDLRFACEEEKLSRTLRREPKYLPDRSLLAAVVGSGVPSTGFDSICVCGPRNLADPHEIFLRLEKYFAITPRAVVACPHHVAHASLAVLGSPFESCFYWTHDGGGEDALFGEMGLFAGNRFRDVREHRAPSLATFYRALTACCGFGDFEEGKIMGLAAYGEPDPNLYRAMKSLFSSDERSLPRFVPGVRYVYPNLRPELLVDFDSWRPHKVVQYLHERSCPELLDLVLDYPVDVIAATGQQLVEDLAVDFVERSRAQLGVQTLPVALGGGFFQNVRVAQAIRTRLGCSIFVPPASNDMGIAAGGALRAHFDVTGKRGARGRLSPFVGPSFDDKAIRRVLEAYSLSYREHPSDAELVEEAASSLAAGEIIGWFQGAAEFGARALGARSILANPLLPDAKARLNQLLKKRDWFMPYAPTILDEYAGGLLEGACDSPYMTQSFDATPRARMLIPAALHVDGTVRPQILARRDNPLYHDLIDAFRRKSGVAAVLNTSFNRHGVPIVGTPADAIDHLLRSVVDKLYLGHFSINAIAPRPRSVPLLPDRVLLQIMQIRRGCRLADLGHRDAGRRIFARTGMTVSYDERARWLTIAGSSWNVSAGAAVWEEIGRKLSESIEQAMPPRHAKRC